MQNYTRQKYIKNTKDSRKTLWAKYDAQPIAVKEWFQNLPIDLWPPSLKPFSQSGQELTERQYLLGLESVWGPDHPAVQDAKRKVVARRGKAQAILTANDLEDLF